MRAEDYPFKALRNNQNGFVIARMDVDATGKVTHCAVVASLGDDAFGKAVCAAAVKRSQLEPAIGADGKPTAAQMVLRIKFQMMPV